MSVNIFATPEAVQFAWHELSGDFILRARIQLNQVQSLIDAKIGWYVRSTPDINSLGINACIHENGTTALEYQQEGNEIQQNKNLPNKNADIIQLERIGQRFIVSSAKYGDTFVSDNLEVEEIGTKVYIGLFITNKEGIIPQDKVMEGYAIIRDIRVIKPPKTGYTPYKDYIGAHLEIINVFTGEQKIVHTSPEQFEAPNWLINGRTIVINISGPGPNKGHLQRFDLETKSLSPFNTGFATNNNNDHVFTFDNKELAISHHSDDDNGQSVIYRLPGEGSSEPIRVTANSPSYFHGWSPDSNWLVFTGGRKPRHADGPEKYDIYKISRDGGEEIMLTDTPGLDDGPEYSPDGKYIYFNSTRSGLMQIWRMEPDGSNPEQLTNDEWNNWFPHPSPDNKWLVFVSFGQDVEPNDHPYYKHVYLRLMPIDRSESPKVIAYVYGGQGTINVPSWSPDSKHVAFVSNTDGL